MSTVRCEVVPIGGRFRVSIAFGPRSRKRMFVDMGFLYALITDDTLGDFLAHTFPTEPDDALSVVEQALRKAHPAGKET